MSATIAEQPAHPHTVAEDVFALLVGTLLIAFGLTMLRQSGIMTGGTAGIGLFLHYYFGWTFGLVFTLINIPFIYLAVKRMGWSFTVKTFASIGLVSAFSGLQSGLIDLKSANVFYVTIMGNLIIGVGFMILFRHKSSLGGLNALALHLQDRYQWRAGWLMMGLDVAILLLSLTITPTDVWLASVLGVVALNILIALNHKKGRYFG